MIQLGRPSHRNWFPAEQHAAAVALNSAGFNVARAIGPALGGIVIAKADSGTAFLLNAVSFFGVILVLYHWRRPAPERIETGALLGRHPRWRSYVRHSSLVRSVLIRTGAFSVGAIALLALLPILARPFGATGYGVLLGCFGVGALAGATILPRLRRRLSVDGLVAAAIVVFAAMTFAAGRISSFGGLCAALATAGSRLDRNSRLPEHGSADDVSVVGKGAGLVDVPARSAGRHGDRQYNVGRLGDARGVTECLAVLGVGAGGGVGHHSKASAERAPSRDGAFGRERLGTVAS